MEEPEEAYEKAIRTDGDNISKAMDSLIDSVSRFKSVERVDEISKEEWGQMLASLDYARFIVSGVMYFYGLPICGHDHEDEE